MDFYAKHRKKCHVPCFTSGSKVIAKNSLMKVEDVKPGDFILTRDNGFKEVLWAGSAKGTKAILYNGSLFSPQHRILVNHNNEEVLISAKRLSEYGQASIVNKEVTYIHFMFDDHEIVNVDNIWSESFYTGNWIMNNSEAGKEIRELFGDFHMNLCREILR